MSGLCPSSDQTNARHRSFVARGEPFQALTRRLPTHTPKTGRFVCVTAVLSHDARDDAYASHLRRLNRLVNLLKIIRAGRASRLPAASDHRRNAFDFVRVLSRLRRWRLEGLLGILWVRRNFTPCHNISCCLKVAPRAS